MKEIEIERTVRIIKEAEPEGRAKTLNERVTESSGGIWLGPGIAVFLLIMTFLSVGLFFILTKTVAELVDLL